jgi:hypothetical protein
MARHLRGERAMHAHRQLFVVSVLSLTALTACLPRMRLETTDPENVETTLFLIGDAGEPDPREIGAPLDSLTAQVAVAPARSIVVFLGDNVYPEGIPEIGRAELADSRRRLEAQVLAVPPGARGIFVPGNHDWGHESPYGLYSLRNQQLMIESLAKGVGGGRDVRMLPGNGCPGPTTVDVGRLRLLILDTQWWLHPYIVRDSASRCRTTLAAVTGELRRQVQVPATRSPVVVVAGHHPLMTGGEHGGYCSVTGPFHRLGGRSQDVMSSANRTMRDSIESAMAAAPPLVYAAGHDHNLQVLRGTKSARYLLVSGAGSPAKAACAVRLRESHYTSQHRSGFMRLDILKNRGVLLRVYRYAGSGSGGLAYSRWLETR